MEPKDADKKQEQKQEKPVAVYTDPEVVAIMETLERIYTVDDAVYNQEQLRRPETYIKPLREMRVGLSAYLTSLTSKGIPAKKD